MRTPRISDINRPGAALLIIMAAAWLCITGAFAETGDSKPPGPPGLKITIEPAKRIYSSREGLTARLIFTARSRTRLCLAKDVLSQMRMTFHRSGTGELPLAPLVIRDNSVLFRQPPEIRWLEPGESLTLRANLKRFRFAGDEQWTPGEYTVSGVFNLCQQTESETVDATAEEIPIKTTGLGWFMIML